MLNTVSILAMVPHTSAWTPGVASVMITCNLLAIVIGRYGIQQKGVSPALPIPLPKMFEGFGIAELLATASLGHVLGAGMILGLSQSGAF